MKKVLSALFSLFVICGIGVAGYFNQQFVLRQYDKAKGIYYVFQGDEAYRKLDRAQAIKFYNKGLKLFPNHYGAWYNLGNIYVAYEDYESALYAYSQAFKYNPKMMVARMNYGIIATEKMGNFDSALKQYSKIINTKRKLISIPYVYNNKLSTAENKAIAYYNTGVTYRMKSLYAGDDWELQRKYLSKAIKAYQKSLDIYPDSYDTLFNLGLAYHISGNYEGAGKCYCKAIKLVPMNYEAHYNLAVLLRKMGYYKEAFEEIDKTSTLITALDENSATQQYVAILMNDIMRSVYHNENYRKKLESILADEEKSLKDRPSKGLFQPKENKKDKKKKKTTLESEGVNLINGRVSATKDLDKAILENFASCPSMIYFEAEEE